jgi:hypothetical protein
MKHFFQFSVALATLTAATFALSAFVSPEKTASTEGYSIQMIGKVTDETNNEQWTWILTNPNPGNGDDGTLQDVSHLSIPVTAEAEAALVAAEYSRDGITWTSVPLSIDRDPTIKQCTSADVLKFDVGTTGTEPLYFRITFNDEFETSGWAKCYIKTGGGRDGCNWYYFTGVANRKLD